MNYINTCWTASRHFVKGTKKWKPLILHWNRVRLYICRQSSWVALELSTWVTCRHVVWLLSIWPAGYQIWWCNWLRWSRMFLPSEKALDAERYQSVMYLWSRGGGHSYFTSPWRDLEAPPWLVMTMLRSHTHSPYLSGHFIPASIMEMSPTQP